MRQLKVAAKVQKFRGDVGYRDNPHLFPAKSPSFRGHGHLAMRKIAVSCSWPLKPRDGVALPSLTCQCGPIKCHAGAAICRAMAHGLALCLSLWTSLSWIASPTYRWRLMRVRPGEFDKQASPRLPLNGCLGKDVGPTSGLSHDLSGHRWVRELDISSARTTMPNGGSLHVYHAE